MNPKNLAPSMSNSTYDKLRYLTQIVLPALATLYFALSGFWGLPAGEQVLGTIAAVEIFLGSLLGLSATKYVESGEAFDGTLNVHTGEETDLFDFEVEGDPHEFVDQQQLRFRVNRN